VCAGAAAALLSRGSLRWGLGDLGEVEPTDLTSDDDADSWTLGWGLGLVEGLLVEGFSARETRFLGLGMGRALEGISEVSSG